MAGEDRNISTRDKRSRTLNFADKAESKRIVDRDFKDLTTAMAHNSVFHAVDTSRFPEVLKKVSSRAKSGWTQPRIVVVVGAGASMSACDLPGGMAAAAHLRQDISRTIAPEILNREIENLKLEHNLEEEDFETILLALSKFDRPRVVEKLQAIFARRYHPALGYELLAHGLKHRFIDAIINFNFDEILDQSIEDELGENSYHKVVLDGDCPDRPVDWFPGNRLSIPAYVKPHGSASQPSSMRFTRDSYTALPSGFRSLLAEMFSNEQPIYILVLGHAMQSVEFNHILKKAAEGRKTYNPITLFFGLSKGAGRFNRVWRDLGKTCTLRFPSESITIDLLLSRMFESVRDALDDPAKPRDIERHRLISRAFAWRRIRDWRTSGEDADRDRQKFRVDQYLQDRIYLELALAVAKAKGFVNLHDIAQARIGKYFKLYRDRVGDKSHIKSLPDACEKLDLHIAGYSHLLAKLDPKHDVVADEKQFKRLAETLTARALSCVSADTRRHLSQKSLAKALMAMHAGEEIEVSALRRPGPTLLRDSSLEVLPTLSALKLRTDELLTEPRRQRDWNFVACTATTGAWLNQTRFVDAFKRNRAALALVVTVNESSVVDGLIKSYGNILLPIQKLPFWNLNQHVTVFLKDGDPKYAIAFERRMRTARITPLFLSAQRDVESAWDTFVAYWLKARRASQKSSVVSTADLQWGTEELTKTVRQRLKRFKRP